jgi:hypothetical protein
MAGLASILCALPRFATCIDIEPFQQWAHTYPSQGKCAISSLKPGDFERPRTASVCCEGRNSTRSREIVSDHSDPAGKRSAGSQTQRPRKILCGISVRALNRAMIRSTMHSLVAAFVPPWLSHPRPDIFLGCDPATKSQTTQPPPWPAPLRPELRLGTT